VIVLRNTLRCAPGGKSNAETALAPTKRRERGASGTPSIVVGAG
jgi:hypothetical protein